MADGRRGGGLISAETVKIGKELALLRAGKKKKKEQATQNRKHLSWRKSGAERWKLSVRPSLDVR